MADADDETEVHSDHEQRLRVLERSATELSTIKRLLGAALVIGATAFGAFAITTVQGWTRLDSLERDVREHAEQPRHIGSDALVSDIRESLVELREQGRGHREALEQIRQRLDRLEQRGAQPRR